MKMKASAEGTSFYVAASRNILSRAYDLLAGFFDRRGIAPLNVQLSETLDLTRWLSAVLVLMFHIRVNILVDPATHPDRYRGLLAGVVLALTNCGEQAVIWFFVISGFLVGGGSLVDAARGKFDARRFILNRVSRVFIVLVPALVLGSVIDGARIFTYGVNINAGGETLDSYSWVTFLGNIASLQFILVPTFGSNIPLWSLGFEVWYYLIAVLILGFAVTRARTSRLVIAAVLIAISALLVWKNYSVLVLMACWLVGAAVRLAPRPVMTSRFWAWLLAAGVMLASPLTVKYLHFLNNLLLAATFANVLVTTMFANKGPALRPRLSHLNQLLAGFSFSLYIVHAPLLHLIFSYYRNSGDPRSQMPLSWPALGIGSAAFIAAVLYAFLFSCLTERNTGWLRTRLAPYILR